MAQTPDFVLASGSPRRKMLLMAAGFSFEVVVPDVDETALAGELPADMVLRLAVEKAMSVAQRLSDRSPEPVVLAADTIVVLDDVVLGKPTDEEDAVKILMQLGGRQHDVMTGFALVSGDTQLVSGQVGSVVRMRPIAEQEARAYVATGEPMDKAGAYGLQGGGAAFVEEVEGSRANVIGLPLGVVVPQLEAAGLTRSTTMLQQ